VDLDEIRRRREAGHGWRRIARAMKTPMTTIRRKFEECQKSPHELRHGASRPARVFEGPEGGAAS
jgi:hypothetical protein